MYHYNPDQHVRDYAAYSCSQLQPKHTSVSVPG